jgi:hypothetical protein
MKMRSMLRYVLDRTPYIGKLRAEIRELKRREGRFPAGHYYSPIPDRLELLDYIHSHPPQSSPEKRGDGNVNFDMIEIDLRKDQQLELLKEYQKYIHDAAFPDQKADDYRYYYQNEFFGYTDAIFLFCFLRHIQPKRIIEVGSGFSSALILDTVGRNFADQTEITFIEPYPDRLNRILRPADRAKVEIIEKRVQDLPLDTFSRLQSGDLLFIDSTHIIKWGSDVHTLMFEVLPRLPIGVYVHFHDIFYPFEYRTEWLENGTYWNELYFIRAFLAYNRHWNIHFFNAYVTLNFRDILADTMPLCLNDSGGSLYLQRSGQ